MLPFKYLFDNRDLAFMLIANREYNRDSRDIKI